MRVTKPVKRESAVMVGHRALMIEVHPGYLKLWQKGKRDAVIVDYGAIFDLGWKIRAREAKCE